MGKGQERGEQEHEQVEPVERAVRSAQRARDPRVGHPDDADRQEARDVGEIRRPLVQDRAQRMVGRVGLDGQLEDEQGDCDCEDAVAERFEAPER